VRRHIILRGHCITEATHLDESTDDTERGEAQVFERTCFGSCVQKGIQEKGYMCFFGSISCMQWYMDAKMVPFKKSCRVSG